MKSERRSRLRELVAAPSIHATKTQIRGGRNLGTPAATSKHEESCKIGSRPNSKRRQPPPNANASEEIKNEKDRNTTPTAGAHLANSATQLCITLSGQTTRKGRVPVARRCAAKAIVWRVCGAVPSQLSVNRGGEEVYAPCRGPSRPLPNDTRKISQQRHKTQVEGARRKTYPECH
jgi:hypothetical protein